MMLLPGVTTDGGVPDVLGLDREALARAGFNADAGTTLLLPAASGSTLLVAVGGGASKEPDAGRLRNAVAVLMRATARHPRIGFDVPAVAGMDAATLGQVLAEGALLGRYRFDVLQATQRMFRWRSCSCEPPESMWTRPLAVWRVRGGDHRSALSRRVRGRHPLGTSGHRRHHAVGHR